MDEKQKVKLDQMNKSKRGKAIIDGKQDDYREDGYSNLLNKYGTAQDNSTAYTYEQEPVVTDLELIRLYEGNGLFTKIIDRPSEEAVKHGFDIDYGDEDIAEYVEERLDELDFEDKFATAEKWARLYGGSVIIMLCNDGRGLEEPLDWEKVTSIEELRVFERAVVQEDYTGLYNFHFNDTLHNGRPFGQPEFYHVYSMYGYFTVHYTRCLIFRNGRLPEQTTNSLYRYWGIPEYVKIKRALRECITTHSNGVKLLERSVQAIYKMKNLANMLGTDEGEDKVLQRLQVIDMARGILNSMAIDSEGEDYDFKTTQMAGVKDVIDSTCNMLSAVTNIPQTVLFGRSPAGMNATGDSDLENYYNMVENIQKQNMKANVRTVIDLILKQGYIEGRIKEIPRYKMKFAALWSLSEAEQASIEQQKAAIEQTKAQTAQTYIDAGVLDPSEVRSSLAKEGDFNIEEVITEEDLELPEDTFAPTEETPVEEIPEEEVATDGNPKGAAVLVIKDGKILCAARRNQEGLCGPGGHIEEGETPEEAAVREAQEEFDIVPLNLIPLGEYKSPTEKFSDSTIYFTDQFSGTPKADEDEMLDERWLTLEELESETLFPPFEKSVILLKKLLTTESQKAIVSSEKNNDGGAGSGNWGHEGRPGSRGGSAKGGGVAHRITTSSGSFTSRAKEIKQKKAEAKGSGSGNGTKGSSTGTTNGAQRVCGKVVPNGNLVSVTTQAGEHQMAEGKDITSTVQVKTDSEWNAFEQVAYQQGFKNPPQVVTDEDVFYEISAESNVIGFRSANTYEKNGETVTGVQVIENFKNYDAEEFKSNTGGGTVHGYGLYFATNASLNDVVTSDVEGRAFYDAKWYANGNDGDAIMKVTLHSSAKIADETQLFKEFDALPFSEKNKYRKMCSDTNMHSSDTEAMSVYAVAKGYDGIQTTDRQTAYTIVYNTSKVVVYDVNEEEY